MITTGLLLVLGLGSPLAWAEELTCLFNSREFITNETIHLRADGGPVSHSGIYELESEFVLLSRVLPIASFEKRGTQATVRFSPGPAHFVTYDRSKLGWVSGHPGPFPIAATLIDGDDAVEGGCYPSTPAS